MLERISIEEKTDDATKDFQKSLNSLRTMNYYRRTNFRNVDGLFV